MIVPHTILAHSLGGLFARFAVAELLDLFEAGIIIPKSFVTMCTPHLGIRRPGSSVYDRFFRTASSIVVNSFYGQSGKDLLWNPVSSSQNPGKSKETQPLLGLMAKADSPFMQALRRFQFRTLVSMTHFDQLVPYFSVTKKYNLFS